MSEAIHVGSGKVRELYSLDEETLALVASDRISTFDVVLATPIPDKGRVLTGLSAFWFARTRDIAPNHLRSLRADGRTMVCRRLDMLPIECVVRGYLAGSGWKDYRETGVVCGHRLADGLEESARLPEPIFTPATKATSGHDENIDEERAAALCGEDVYSAAKEASLALYRHGSEYAEARGIILADTKFEFGVAPDGSAGTRRRGVDARLVPLLARRRLRTWKGSTLVRQAVRPRLGRGDRAGTRSRRGQSFRRTSSPVLERATSRRSNGSPRSRSRSYVANPEVVLEGHRARPAEAGHPRSARRGGAALPAQARVRRVGGAGGQAHRPRARRRRLGRRTRRARADVQRAPREPPHRELRDPVARAGGPAAPS